MSERSSEQKDLVQRWGLLSEAKAQVMLRWQTTPDLGREPFWVRNRDRPGQPATWTSPRRRSPDSFPLQHSILLLLLLVKEALYQTSCVCIRQGFVFRELLSLLLRSTLE